MKSAGVLDIVSQRIVIPDLWDDSNFLKLSFMIMEFDDIKTTSQFYTKTQESIRSQNFPTSSEYSELEKQGVYGDKMELEKSSEYFVADCIGQMINYLQENEEVKLTCTKENYIIAVMVSQKTDLYNTSYTWGGPESSAYGFSEIIIGKIIDKKFQENYGERSGIISIHDKISCTTVIEKAEWIVDNFGNGKCFVKILKIESDETLNFSRGGMVFNSQTTFENKGTFNILGDDDTWALLDTWGKFENHGTINISGSLGVEEGSFINKGTININPHGSLITFDEGSLENYGVVKNNDQLINHGTINNYCDGLISGNPVGEKTYGFGKNPINQIPCTQIQKETVENPSKVPDWVKNNAKWWSEGNVNDQTFVNGIAFLIKEKILSIEKSDLISNTQFVENEVDECYSQLKVPKKINDVTESGLYRIYVEYNPEKPIQECLMEWKIRFYNPFESTELIEQVQFDFLVVDDDLTPLRSIAQEEGRQYLYSPSGYYDFEMIVDEKIGFSNYVIWIYGSAPEGNIPSSSSDYFSLKLPVISKTTIVKSPMPTSTEIPAWIKNNAGWWAEGMISEDDFIKGVKYLVETGIIKVG